MRSQHFEAKLTHEGDDIVGRVESYGDPLFMLECLSMIVGEIAKTSGVPPLDVAADLHGLIARRQRMEAGGLKMTDYANELRRHARKIGHPAGDVPAVMQAAADRLDELERLVDAAIRARNEQIRSKIRPEFDHLYVETPGIFDLVTVEEFAARMGVSVADVMNDGTMRSSRGSGGWNRTKKFDRGDRVRKKSGSKWQGIVVGEYSTELNPEGYAVESESHAGSVNIYPASALELIQRAEAGG